MVTHATGMQHSFSVGTVLTKQHHCSRQLETCCPRKNTIANPRRNTCQRWGNSWLNRPKTDNATKQQKSSKVWNRYTNFTTAAYRSASSQSMLCYIDLFRLHNAKIYCTWHTTQASQAIEGKDRCTTQCVSIITDRIRQTGLTRKFYNVDHGQETLHRQEIIGNYICSHQMDH